MITEANKNVILRLTISSITYPFCDEVSQKQEGSQLQNDLLQEFFQTVLDYLLHITKDKVQGNSFFTTWGIFFFLYNPFFLSNNT